jgi:hypothetical protein
VRSAPAKPASQPAAPVSAGGQSGGDDWSFQSKPWLYYAGGAAALVLVVILGITMFSGSGKSSSGTSGSSGTAAQASTTPATPGKSAITTTGPLAPVVARARTESTTNSTNATVPKAVATTPATNELRLQGIFFSQYLRVNEKYQGNKVISIGRSNVVLEFNGQRKTLSLK